MKDRCRTTTERILQFSNLNIQVSEPLILKKATH